MEWTLFIVLAPCASPGHLSREGLIADGLTWFHYATMVDGVFDNLNHCVFIRITRILGFFFFLSLLNDCPQRSADCNAMPMEPPSKSPWVFIPSTASSQTTRLEHKRKEAELDQSVRVYLFFVCCCCCCHFFCVKRWQLWPWKESRTVTGV